MMRKMIHAQRKIFIGIGVVVGAILAVIIGLIIGTYANGLRSPKFDTISDEVKQVHGDVELISYEGANWGNDMDDKMAKFTLKDKDGIVFDVYSGPVGDEGITLTYDMWGQSWLSEKSTQELIEKNGGKYVFRYDGTISRIEVSNNDESNKKLAKILKEHIHVIPSELVETYTPYNYVAICINDGENIHGMDVYEYIEMYTEKGDEINENEV